MPGPRLQGHKVSRKPSCNEGIYLEVNSPLARTESQNVAWQDSHGLVKLQHSRGKIFILEVEERYIRLKELQRKVGGERRRLPGQRNGWNLDKQVRPSRECGVWHFRIAIVAEEWIEVKTM